METSTLQRQVIGIMLLAARWTWPMARAEAISFFIYGVNQMGLFWDLIQQSQISDQKDRSASLEQRVALLENELAQTRKTLHQLVVILEKEYGKDIDGNGRIG